VALSPISRGGLANAGWPDNTDKFPFLDGQINFSEHFLLTITQGQLAGADVEHNCPRGDTGFSLKGICRQVTGHSLAIGLDSVFFLFQSSVCHWQLLTQGQTDTRICPGVENNLSAIVHNGERFTFRISGEICSNGIFVKCS
jgi:hypothetical protein